MLEITANYSVDWRPDRGLDKSVDSTASDCLTMRIPPRNAAGSRTKRLTQTVPDYDPAMDLPPEGHAVESWAAACDVAERLGALIGPFDPAPPRCIQDLRDGKCYVYFIGDQDTPIKIGFSAQPFERLTILQTAHWCKLSIIAKVEGTLATEKAYHQQFAHIRLHGEWFERTPELLAEIERLSL